MGNKKVIKTKEELIDYQAGKVKQGSALEVIHTIVVNMIYKSHSDNEILDYIIDTFTNSCNKVGGDLQTGYTNLIAISTKLKEIAEAAEKELDELDKIMNINVRLIDIYKKIGEIASALVAELKRANED